MPSKKLFGTDGVRGEANRKLTAELALSLGAAAARVLADGKPVRVVIGRDTRRSGSMLGGALAAGFCSQGADAVSVGVLPTPGVAHLVRHSDFDLGAVISASHNPAEDNGIKFFGPDGRKLSDEQEARIEAAMAETDAPKPGGAEVGQIEVRPELGRLYADYLASLIPKPLNGLKVVVDGAHGAAFSIGPEVLRRLGAEVIALSVEPDGVNINRDCGSTHPQAMMEAVRAHGAALGAAFDGDADRVILADENGVRVDGDRVIALWSLHEMAAGRLTPPSAVGTVMSNMGFERLLRGHGVELIRTAVGDRYVSEAMEQRGSLVGGEQSGHVIFADRSTTGDGLITLLETLRVMQESGRPLSDLAHQFKPWPQRLVNLRIREREGWDANVRVTDAIRQVETALQGVGRINVRPSGTEPLLRVMVEAETLNLMEQNLGLVVSAIEEELGGQVHSVTELSDHAAGG